MGAVAEAAHTMMMMRKREREEVSVERERGCAYREKRETEREMARTGRTGALGLTTMASEHRDARGGGLVGVRGVRCFFFACFERV